MNEIIKAENGRKKNIRIYIATLLAVQMLMLPISSCSSSSDNSQISGSASAAVATLADVGGTEVSTVKKTSSDSLNADELFTERDLIQSPDLSGAKELTKPQAILCVLTRILAKYGGKDASRTCVERF